MNYDNTLTLIGYTFETEDSLGQKIGVPIETTVLCAEKSIGYREFYAAASSGIRPEVVLVIHKFEYSGQTEVVFNGTAMKVVRIYAISSDEIELTCASAVGVSGGS